jgi:ribonuclease BN (tRNA processing enzyme)
MKLTFLGSGSAFTLENFQSNMLLEIDGHRLLIDCGGDCRHALRAQNLGPADIDAVYISHLHADHVGGLEWLALTRYFHPKRQRPHLYVNEKLAAELWQNTLQGGLGTLQNRIADLDTYFEVKRLGRNEGFDFNGAHLQTVQTVHYMDGYEIVPSFGLIWKAPDGRTVFLTTDTQFCPNQIRDFYRCADLIFHDCETGQPASGIHAHFDELVTLPVELRKRMWLYHYRDGERPNAEAAGFAGWVEKGQTFRF